MPISRLTTWQSLDVLTAAALNNEFSNLADKVADVTANETISGNWTFSGTLYHANAFNRVFIVRVVDIGVALATGNGQYYLSMPEECDGMDLVTVGAHVFVPPAAAGGAVSVMIHNHTLIQDMLSTPVTIDEEELDSATAATPPVVNLATDNVATGHLIRVDVDAAGTSTEGLEIRLGFRKP